MNKKQLLGISLLFLMFFVTVVKSALKADKESILHDESIKIKTMPELRHIIINRSVRNDIEYRSNPKMTIEGPDIDSKIAVEGPEIDPGILIPPSKPDIAAAND